MATGKVIKLLDIYQLLTLLPGQSKEYTKEEFARDIYLLDKSGITTTNNGFVLSLIPPKYSRKNFKEKS